MRKFPRILDFRLKKVFIAKSAKKRFLHTNSGVASLLGVSTSNCTPAAPSLSLSFGHNPCLGGGGHISRMGRHNQWFGGHGPVLPHPPWRRAWSLRKTLYDGGFEPIVNSVSTISNKSTGTVNHWKIPSRCSKHKIIITKKCADHLIVSVWRCLMARG